MPHLSFRAKRGISPSITNRLNDDRLNDEILRFAQDDNLEQGASFRAVSRNEPAPFHPLGCKLQACMKDSRKAPVPLPFTGCCFSSLILLFPG